MSWLHGHEHDEMECNATKRKTWLNNHLSSKYNKQAQKTKGLVLQNKSSLNVFSLKGFLQKKSITKLV